MFRYKFINLEFPLIIGFLMSNPKSSVAEEASEKDVDTFIKIIDKLSGAKENFKISFEQFKFNVGESKLTLNGDLNFNFIRSKILKGAEES